MEYRIRKSADADQITRLNEKTFPADPLHGKYQDHVTHSWVLYSGEEEAGFVSIKVMGKLAVLTRVGVISAHRGKKLQIKLMKHAIAYCKKNGFKSVTTYVKSSNIPSFKNILRTGFMPYRPKKPYAEKDIVYLIYRLTK